MVNTLKAVIVDRGLTVPETATKMNVSAATLRAKLADTDKFTVAEVRRLGKVLKIEGPEIQRLFF